MRNYRVPVGMSEEEQAKAQEYFDKNKKVVKKWYQFWKKSNKMHEMYSSNDHSKVIYLMSPENNFITFYDIGTEL